MPNKRNRSGGSRLVRILLSFSSLLFGLPAFAQAPNLTQYVNPLIGTRKMGHTYLGATVLFGSVQLSPDTDEQPHNTGGPYNKDAYRWFR